MADKPLTRNNQHDGMLPFFELVNSFVDSLVPRTIGDIITEYDIHKYSDFKDVTPETWIKMAIGLAICITIGVLFVLCLPVFGCCFCCCRNCCNSGAPKRDSRGKPKQASSCKKCSCITISLGLITAMFASIVCSFIAISMIKTEIADNEVTNDVIISLETVETYLNDSVCDIDNAIFPPFSTTKTEVFEILNNLPNSTLNKFAKDTGVDPALFELEKYTQNIPSLHGNLTLMEECRKDLIQQEITLDSSLSSARSDIGPLLNQCMSSYPGLKCDELSTSLDDLKPYAQYDNLDTVSNAILFTKVAIDIGVPVEVSEFVEAFVNISNIIEEEMGEQVKDLETKVDEIEDELNEQFEKISETVTGINFNSAKDQIKKYQPDIKEYGTWYYLFLYGISCLCLVPLLLYVTGIAFGMIGGSSSSKHGSNCIMAGIAITFIFGSIFMIAALVPFIIGSITEAGFCCHAVTYDETLQELEKIIRNERFLGGNREDPYNLTIRELLDDCKDNVALYTAFNVAENIFNISEYLDLENTELPALIEDIKNTSFNIGNITIITPEINQAVLAIEDETNQIDFYEYQTELNKEITKTNVKEYSDNLRNVATDIRNKGNHTLADEIETQADELDKIYNTTIADMENNRNNLSESTFNVHQITTSVNLSVVMYNLTMAQEVLNTETDSLIANIVGETADEIYDLLDGLAKNLTKSIEEDIAQCFPVYDAMTTLVYGPCVYFLYPFNAVWFCYGWYVAFGIIALFFCVSLVNMFRAKALLSKTTTEDRNGNPSYNDIAMANVAFYQSRNQSRTYDNNAYHMPPPDYDSVNHQNHMAEEALTEQWTKLMKQSPSYY